MFGIQNKSDKKRTKPYKNTGSYFVLKANFELKEQSHEKVGKMRVEGDSLGPN
jgi:hypothetical protein